MLADMATTASSSATLARLLAVSSPHSPSHSSSSDSLRILNPQPKLLATSSSSRQPGRIPTRSLHLAGLAKAQTLEAEAQTGKSKGEEEDKEEEEEAKEGTRKKWRTIKFAKYQGLGNDFILIDNRAQSETLVSREEAVQMCNRNFGIGGDGVIFLLPSAIKDAQFGMRIFNSDGSEPEMCGNGVRCLAKFIQDLDDVSPGEPCRYVVSTLAGNMVLDLKEDGQVQVDMGEPILKGTDVPTTLPPSTDQGSVVNVPLEVDGKTWNVTCVSMGNPHCIVFSSSQDPQQGLDVAELDLAAIGPRFEHHPAFPARTNTEFAQVISRNEIKMRVWERGAGATLACGTGACALVVAGVLEGRTDRNCLVHLPGGPLEIVWDAQDNRVYMTGPAQRVFEGKILLPHQN